MSDKMIPARFTCSYQRYGDGDGVQWMKDVLANSNSHMKIDGFHVFMSEVGIWGIQYIVFSVDILIPLLTTHDDAKDLVLPELNQIIGDSDVEILWVSAA